MHGLSREIVLQHWSIIEQTTWSGIRWAGLVVPIYELDACAPQAQIQIIVEGRALCKAEANIFESVSKIHYCADASMDKFDLISHIGWDKAGHQFLIQECILE